MTGYLIFHFLLDIACGRKKNQSWYTKQNLVSIVDEYQNLDLIGNARIDSVMYDPAPAHTGRRGRPDKHGKRLSVETNFAFSNEKIGDYYIGAHRVITNLFGCREIQAYVTATEKEPLNQTGSDRMKYIPLFLYSFRWNIETSYYEQKTFWSLCSYMVRSCKGIEMLVNRNTYKIKCYHKGFKTADSSASLLIIKL